MRALERDDVPVAIKNEDVEVRMTEVGDMTVSFIRLTEGTDLGPALAGLEGDRCPCPHWGYMLEGTLTMKTADGDQTYRAGQAFYWGPGHVPVAATDCSYVDFSPTEEFREVIDHITRG